jgi:hypothetical protein
MVYDYGHRRWLRRIQYRVLMIFVRSYIHPYGYISFENRAELTMVQTFQLLANRTTTFQQYGYVYDQPLMVIRRTKLIDPTIERTEFRRLIKKLWDCVVPGQIFRFTNYYYSLVWRGSGLHPVAGTDFLSTIKDSFIVAKPRWFSIETSYIYMDHFTPHICRFFRRRK